MKIRRGSAVLRFARSAMAAPLVVLGAAGCDSGGSNTVVKEAPHAAETVKNQENFMKNNPVSLPPAGAPKATPSPSVK